MKTQIKDMRLETKDAREPLEVKRVALSVEALSESDGTFSGKGMVFDSEHPTSSWQLGPEWKDRVRPGAFTETLAAHAKAGTKPLMLYMHERVNIPGVWTDVKETKSALSLSGQVSKNAVTPSGVPLLELMKMGAITGLSIGFRPTQTSLDETKKLRDIHKVDLAEVSIVDQPGSPTARITDVKRDIRGLEEGLRTLGLSRREAKALLAEGFGAISDGAKAEEDKGLTNVAKKAMDSSCAADEATTEAKAAHGAATVAHAAAMAAHLSAAHDRSMAAQQSAEKGDSEQAAQHDAAAKRHLASADSHRTATAVLGSTYSTNAAGDAAETKARATKAGDVEETLAMLTNAEMAKKESGHANKMSDDLRNGIHEAVHPGIKKAAHYVAQVSHERAASFHAAAAKDEAQKVKTPGNKTVAQASHEKQAAEHSRNAEFHKAKVDEYHRDDHGRFANTKSAHLVGLERTQKKSVLDVAHELKQFMQGSGETPEQKARRDAEGRVAKSILDVAKLIKP